MTVTPGCWAPWSAPELAPRLGADDASLGFAVSAQRLQRLPFGLRGRVKVGAQQLLEQPMAHKVLYAGGQGTLRFYGYAVSPADSPSFPGLPTGGDRMLHGSLELGYGLNSVLEPLYSLMLATAFQGAWFEPSSLRPLRMAGCVLGFWGVAALAGASLSL